ncbi:MAG: carboxypeptidase-like regulatory domain-containing protein, partial [Bacteroidales bacterium]|nr:carboxypeptidase-like regulatory domain-containing protein [Bacteroidales bacterium]
MYKRIFFAFTALLLSVSLWAQTGGVRGTIVNRSGRVPVAGASIELSEGNEIVVRGTSGSDGRFLFEGIDDGIYGMSVKAEGFVPAHVNVTVEKGFVKDMMFVSLVAARNVVEADDSSFAEFDMDDSGYSDTPSILFSNDVYTDIVGFGFSAIRFKNRGYNSETQDVYLSGVKMNDAITGYSPYSLWSGLNEATRSKETTVGKDASDYGAGGYNGV